MALLDKILGKDETEEKLKQEIKSLEFRKKTVLTSINGEIANLESEQRALFLEAGKNAYDSWCMDKTQADLTHYWDKVQNLADKIEEQEAKKKEMTERYDEEIKLIAGSLHSGMSTASTAARVAVGSAECPHCGAAIAADDAFCQGCGTKLR